MAHPRQSDQAFTRLARTHAACAAADTLVTIALAKTLFFVSPDQAQGRVLRYLLLTLGPFAVLSPFLGPLIDRFSAYRRWIVVGTAVARAIICLLMSQDVQTNSLLLFPEAFSILALSKAYAIARTSLVPTVVPNAKALVRANSRLALIAGISGAIAALPGGILGSISFFGPRAVLSLAFFAFLGAAFLATKIESPFEHVALDVPVEAAKPSRRLPRGRRGPAVGSRNEQDHLEPAAGHDPFGSRTLRGAFDQARDRITLLRLAAIAMAVERGLVGFITFLCAFTFKREGAATAWLGVVGGAGVVGGMLGNLIAPRLRNRVDESRIMVGTLAFVFVSSVIGVIKGERLIAALLAFTVAFSAAVSRLAFDALVQRFGDSREHGTTFARYETRFQLAWVFGAIIPVVTPISRTVGALIMAIVAGTAVAIHLGGESSLQRIDATVQKGASAWKKPAVANKSDWDPETDWDRED